MPHGAGHDLKEAGKSSFEAAKNALHNAGEKTKDAMHATKDKAGELKDEARAKMHGEHKATTKARDAKDDACRAVGKLGDQL